MAMEISALPIAKYVLGFLVTYYLVLAGYNIFLHPLRKYPGPFWAKITHAYGGYHAVRRRLPRVTQRDLKSYGPVIRHGPNRLVFSSARALHDIYNNDRIAKSDVYLVTLENTASACLFNCIDKSMHRTRRKLVGSVVTERAMRNFEPVMSGQVDIFLRHLSQASDPVDMAKRASYLGADIVALLAFGFPLNTQTEEKHRFLPATITIGSGVQNMKMQMPSLSAGWLAALTSLPVYFKVKRFFDLLEYIIATRVAKGNDGAVDLYGQVMEQLADYSDVRTSDIWAEAVCFIPAGGDTVATAMSSLFFYLSRNPECYKKLAEEVRSTFSSGKEISGGPKLASCRYLRACIDEALRMSPPVSGTLWRERQAGEEKGEPLVVDGHVIPPGTIVGVNCYAIHHDETYFPDSYSYKPERWLEADDETRRRMNSAFCAFSIGARGCAGKPMAYLEVSLVIAKSLWYFDFETAPGDAGRVGEGEERRGEYQIYDVFTSTQSGPNLIFHPRVPVEE